jgi:hypothetical protein
MSNHAGWLRVGGSGVLASTRASISEKSIPSQWIAETNCRISTVAKFFVKP